jgi:TPR repeat protein
MFKISYISGYLLATHEGVLIFVMPLVGIDCDLANRLCLNVVMRKDLFHRLSYNQHSDFVNMRDMRRFQSLIERRVASKQNAKNFKVFGNQFLENAKHLCLIGYFDEAVSHYETAIYMGNTEARARLALLLSEGREGVPKDIKRACDLISEGSRRGCEDCNAVLANFMYREGVFPPLWIDWTVADELVHKYYKSQFARLLLGYMHQDGKIRKQNDARAVRCFKEAAANGIPAAFIQIAKIIKYSSDGLEEERNRQAFEWFMKAAEQGHPDGLFWVARCYREGQGVERNKDAAIHWYKRAKAAGNESARHILKEMFC